ncbi:kinase-like domain-containing protein [Rhodocollybia butyracea]|uniref:Kinase-like domain-containing protein n=1 Tax=Rhodocollybia butyracea TaxID=206335 RepID=A0A9P5PVX4_9AGAR|nr:kinase-like domain-containing protein [Rhodocollybia butyracea]
MLAAATSAASSFFARTNISQTYNVGTTTNTSSNTGSRSSTPGPQSPSPSSPFSASFTPTIFIGLWKVQGATHKVNNKKVSVWSFDKRGPDMERLGPLAKERTLEVLKAEASALSRFRHPSILEMVEPLEETRTELIFATELVICSLEQAIPGAGKLASLVELDEVEIQKGILQICKGLIFLHSSAQLIHSNLCPESIIINRAGDWKISGLGLTIPLMTNGVPTNWEFPTFDGRVPRYIQRSFDYTAPEYALDEMLVTSSDMYSLGVIIYVVHCKGSAPYKTHGSLSGLRENAGRPVPGMERLEPDLQSLLRSLITRNHNGRPTPSTLPADPFFSSLPISTLNFLDRSNFTAKTREEKISFMKGLTSVLGRFSEGLKSRKILPSLLEEMKDFHLLPYILPNVFAIATALSPAQFASMVLPLVYNALESEHAMIQERALKMVPDLCESIDYAEVQGVLFPRVALVFTKTRILTVKVATLATFLAMVKTLDQSSLTQKMVPLLSKIRTKEPAVTMATLSVQEAMGFKVDREAVATLVLPQLWSMSMGPLLNIGQFQRFMEVIKKLGERVEKEHNQFLRDSQRHEDRSTVTVDGVGTQSFGGSVDFESLVGGKNGAVQIDATGGSVGSGNINAGKSSWDDDVWGSIFNDTTPSNGTPALAPTTISPVSSLPASPQSTSIQPMKLGSSKPYLAPQFAPPPNHRASSSGFVLPLSSTSTASPFVASMQPNSFSPTQPVPPLSGGPLQPSKPNYNISLPAAAPSLPVAAPSSALGFLGSPSTMGSMQPAMRPSGVMGNSSIAGGGLLTPSKPPPPPWKTSNKPSKDDWGDFDPLS